MLKNCHFIEHPSTLKQVTESNIFTESAEEATNILLIEDSSLDYKTFCSAFDSYHVNITWCKTSEDAWQIITNNPDKFDLVVADYKLPNMSGLDFCKLILKNKIDVPTVLLTGKGDEHIAVDAIKSGVEDYIVKDLNNDYLQTIASTLSIIITHYKRG